MNKNNQRFTENDYNIWCDEYENGLSLQKIADKYKDNYLPTKSPSKSLIRKVIEERDLTRTLSEAQKGRPAWNKGKTGGVAWNSGRKGNYPYPSPFKGKESPFKDIPRSKEDKAKIAHSIRLQNRNHYGFYAGRENEPDKLYLIRIKSNQKPYVQFKIGRTFNTLAQRYSWDLGDKEEIKIWESTHGNIFYLEQQALNDFQEYHQPGPESFPGATEFFSDQLPVSEFIDYVDNILDTLENY